MSATDEQLLCARCGLGVECYAPPGTWGPVMYLCRGCGWLARECGCRGEPPVVEL
jgi:hypothetical protein